MSVIPNLIASFYRIVEFASTEDAQRAIRELSEQLLLGRPVFIREVSVPIVAAKVPLTRFRTVNMNLGSVLHQCRARSAWPWRGKACTLPLRLGRPPTTTSHTRTLAINFTLGM